MKKAVGTLLLSLTVLATSQVNAAMFAVGPNGQKDIEKISIGVASGESASFTYSGLAGKNFTNSHFLVALELEEKLTKNMIMNGIRKYLPEVNEADIIDNMAKDLMRAYKSSKKEVKMAIRKGLRNMGADNIIGLAMDEEKIKKYATQIEADDQLTDKMMKVLGTEGL
jgi:hypothetical protein